MTAKALQLLTLNKIVSLHFYPFSKYSIRSTKKKKKRTLEPWPARQPACNAGPVAEAPKGSDTPRQRDRGDWSRRWPAAGAGRRQRSASYASSALRDAGGWVGVRATEQSDRRRGLSMHRGKNERLRKINHRLKARCVLQGFHGNIKKPSRQLWDRKSKRVDTVFNGKESIATDKAVFTARARVLLNPESWSSDFKTWVHQVSSWPPVTVRKCEERIQNTEFWPTSGSQGLHWVIGSNSRQFPYSLSAWFGGYLVDPQMVSWPREWELPVRRAKWKPLRCPSSPPPAPHLQYLIIWSFLEIGSLQMLLFKLKSYWSRVGI